MICEHILLKTFVNEPELILFNTVPKERLVLDCNTWNHLIVCKQ